MTPPGRIRGRAPVRLDRAALQHALGARHTVMEASEIRAKGAPGVNAAVLWKYFTTSVYESADLPIVATREALQNAVDAIRASVRKRQIRAGEGRFEVTWEPSLHALSWADNGVGMDAETVLTKFLFLGESGKRDATSSEEAAGGFGVAKAVILGTSTTFQWEMRTRDNLVMSPGHGKDVVVYEAPARQGTYLRIFDVDPKYDQVWDRARQTNVGLLDRLRELLAANDLPDITLVLNGQEVRPMFSRRGGARVPIAGSWGHGTSATIKAYRRPPGDRGGGYYVRLGGLFQYKRPAVRDALKADVVLDLVTAVRPGEAGYPLKAGRDGFVEPAASTFWDVVDEVEKENESIGRSDADEVYEPDSDDADMRQGAGELAAQLLTAMQDPAFQAALTEATGGIADFYGGLLSYKDTVAPVSSAAPRTTKAQPDDDVPTSGVVLPPGFQAGAVAPPMEKDIAAPSAVKALSTFLQASDAGRAVQLGTVDIGQGGLFTPEVEAALDRLGVNQASGSDLAKIETALELAGEAAMAPGGGGLVAASKIPGLFKALNVLSGGRTRVRRNPFGSLAGLRINKKTYDRGRAYRFRKSFARWLPYLTVWDATLRMIASEARVARSFKPGFILNDDVMALTAAENSGNVVYVHPDKLAAIVKGQRSRPIAIAAYLHGTACHELAHLDGRMGEGHSERYVVAREDMGAATGHLLPAIALLVQHVLGLPESNDQASARSLREEGTRLRARHAETRKQLARLQGQYQRTRRELDALRAKATAEGTTRCGCKHDHAAGLLPEMRALLGRFPADLRAWAEANPAEANRRFQALSARGVSEPCPAKRDCPCAEHLPAKARLTPRQEAVTPGVLAFVRTTFADMNAAELARWKKPLSETAGVQETAIAEHLGWTARQTRGLLQVLLSFGWLTLTDEATLSGGRRVGVAGGGAGNFHPRQVPTEYVQRRYRITSAGERRLRELGGSMMETLPARQRSGAPGVGCPTGECEARFVEPTRVQSLLFSRAVFPTAADARRWAERHDFSVVLGVDRTKDNWRLRQEDPKGFDPDTFRTIPFREGVQAIIASPRPAGRRP